MASPGRGRRLVRVGLAVVLGVSVALAVDVARSGGVGSWLARHRLPPPYVPLGRLVDVDARSLYIDCRGAGTPTVVLESGAGDQASAWTAIHDTLAATTRTCAYDRAGLGSSDPRERHTLVDAATDLRQLLSAAGEPGPFVAVGHSLGGAYARVFAERYRAEVAGLVLVDSFEPDLESRFIHPRLGDLRPEYEDRLDSLRAAVAAGENLDWERSEAQLAGSTITGLPVEVLRAPRTEPRLDEVTNAAIADAWIAAFETLSPGNVRYELAWGAGHIIQVDRPDLVIAAVLRQVDAVRAR